MKLQRALIAVSLINLTLLVVLLVQFRGIRRNIDGTILRGKGLEIVDDAGRVRASISVLPENDQHRTDDGKPWPATVLLRLINEQGGPNVKLAATERGAGLLLGGASLPRPPEGKGQSYIQILTEKDKTKVRLLNGDGKEMVVKPGG